MRVLITSALYCAAVLGTVQSVAGQAADATVEIKPEARAGVGLTYIDLTITNGKPHPMNPLLEVTVGGQVYNGSWTQNPDLSYSITVSPSIPEGTREVTVKIQMKDGTTKTARRRVKFPTPKPAS